MQAYADRVAATWPALLKLFDETCHLGVHAISIDAVFVGDTLAEAAVVIQWPYFLYCLTLSLQLFSTSAILWAWVSKVTIWLVNLTFPQKMWKNVKYNAQFIYWNIFSQFGHHHETDCLTLSLQLLSTSAILWAWVSKVTIWLVNLTFPQKMRKNVKYNAQFIYWNIFSQFGHHHETDCLTLSLQLLSTSAILWAWVSKVTIWLVNLTFPQKMRKNVKYNAQFIYWNIFSQFGHHHETDCLTLSLQLFSTSAILWLGFLKWLFDWLI